MSSKAKNLLQWALVVIISLQFLIHGYGKLSGNLNEVYASWGQSNIFLLVLGSTQILTAIGILFSRYRLPSCFVMILMLFGATYNNWVHQDSFSVLINIGMIGLVAMVLWFEQEKKYYNIDVENKPVRFL